MNNTLALIKEKVGHGKVKKFVRAELGMQYRTFVYQLKHGLVTYKVIKKIIVKLDIKFEDFKDYEYSEDHKVHSHAERAKGREVNASLRDLHMEKPKKLSELLSNK